ncbi:hypothetical protein [Clostridium sp. YIM B02551]|uniref:hypothetical protein n=1 Tax=Clostridium sp. YIM B02551 TaxID=2910679 RepID=UPI001EEBA186|nr:hypothetical protein [Clostridium sp. YIM B02551]
MVGENILYIKINGQVIYRENQKVNCIPKGELITCEEPNANDIRYIQEGDT